MLNTKYEKDLARVFTPDNFWNLDQKANTNIAQFSTLFRNAVTKSQVPIELGQGNKMPSRAKLVYKPLMKQIINYSKHSAKTNQNFDLRQMIGAVKNDIGLDSDYINVIDNLFRSSVSPQNKHDLENKTKIVDFIGGMIGAAKMGINLDGVFKEAMQGDNQR